MRKNKMQNIYIKKKSYIIYTGMNDCVNENLFYEPDRYVLYTYHICVHISFFIYIEHAYNFELKIKFLLRCNCQFLN